MAFAVQIFSEGFERTYQNKHTNVFRYIPTVPTYLIFVNMNDIKVHTYTEKFDEKIAVHTRKIVRKCRVGRKSNGLNFWEYLRNQMQLLINFGPNVHHFIKKITTAFCTAHKPRVHFSESSAT